MFKQIAAAALVLAFAVPAFAQGPETPGLDKREVRMEKRIEQGKASGALNDKEAARLEKRKANLEQDAVRFEVRYVGPASEASSSIGLSVTGIEPLPDALPLKSRLIAPSGARTTRISSRLGFISRQPRHCRIGIFFCICIYWHFYF